MEMEYFVQKRRIRRNLKIFLENLKEFIKFLKTFLNNTLL